MKSLILAAAFATVLALPAIAEDAPAAAASSEARPLRPPREGMGGGMRDQIRQDMQGMRAEGKDMREGMRADHKEMRDEHHTEAQAAREDCHKRMEAAEGADAKKAILDECRGKADSMRKQFFDENSQRISERRTEQDQHMAEMGDKRDAFKARRAEMKAKREAATAQ